MRRVVRVQGVLRGCVITLLVVAVAGFAFAGGTAETQKPIIGISKIVSHPALDAVEKGIQDQLKDQGLDV